MVAIYHFPIPVLMLRSLCPPPATQPIKGLCLVELCKPSLLRHLSLALPAPAPTVWRELCFPLVIRSMPTPAPNNTVILFAWCCSGTSQERPDGHLNCPLNGTSAASLGESRPPMESKASRPTAFKVAGVRNKNFPSALLGVAVCIYSHLSLNSWTVFLLCGCKGTLKPLGRQVLMALPSIATEPDKPGRGFSPQSFFPGCPASSQCPGVR